MNPLPFENCNEEEQHVREFAAECARDELEEMGYDEEFIDCVIQDILDGHSVEVFTQ